MITAEKNWDPTIILDALRFLNLNPKKPEESGSQWTKPEKGSKKKGGQTGQQRWQR